MSVTWTYPPLQSKPDKTKPARLVYDEASKQLFIEFYDMQNKLYRVPVHIIILPPELKELSEALGLKDLFPPISVEVEVPQLTIDWTPVLEKLQVLDIPLSSIDSSIKDTLPRNLTHIAGTALTARDWSLDFEKLQSIDVTLSSIKNSLNNFDIALTSLAKLQRWGRDVTPIWIHGAEITAPPANTPLVSKTVSAGKTGYIYGFFIHANEANDFRINWVSGATAYSIRITFSGRGSLQYVDFIALNEGLPADSETTISITNVNDGSSGVVYQARLLYAEV